MKNPLFSFDVSLQQLMNLGDRAKEVKKLDIVLKVLKSFWYDLSDKDRDQKRWDSTRVGSVDVFLNDDKQVCMQFTTRFHFENTPDVLELLESLNAHK